MRLSRSIRALVVLGAALTLPAIGAGAEPPNQNDPCSVAGQNTCDTLGEGFYERYRYGIRWFGDYRGAIPGTPSSFCIDLRFWYPSEDYDYKELDRGTPLDNKDGDSVTTRDQRKMAYAIWNHGRTKNDTRQAATMLYVHNLMGDGQPGEVDPTELDDPAVAQRFNAIADESAKFHGPYRVIVTLPKKLTAGRSVRGTVRVRAATGRFVPRVNVNLTATGANTPKRVRTNAKGIGRFTLTPTGDAKVRLTARTQKLASTLPRFFTPTRGASAVNGQRLAVPASQRPRRVVQRNVERVDLKVTTRATPRRMTLGTVSRDTVRFRGVSKNWRQRAQVLLHGPFASKADITCDQTPAWRSSFTARGGTVRTPRVRPREVGLYTYQIIVPGTPTTDEVVTPCGIPAETIRVEAEPEVTTVVSEARLTPGAALFDNVKVTGLAGQSAVVKLDLYGPFPTREAISCDIEPVWSGSIPVPGDGDYVSETVNLAQPGYYSYRERIDAGGFVKAIQNECGVALETTIVVGQPRITTQISKQIARPGAEVTDSVVVTGLGTLPATVQVELWGPYATKQEMSCAGEAFHTESFTATGDGTYVTQPVTLPAAGYYTYREYILGTQEHEGTQTLCGEATETVIVQAAPRVTTRVSRDIVKPGAAIFDRVAVKGAGTTKVNVKLDLYGPFPTRAAIRCTGTPVWSGTVQADGNGTFRSPPARLAKAGFYTYRERVVASPTVRGRVNKCALVSETSLARPLILTGRGEPRTTNARTNAAGVRPTRIRLARLGINAPVANAAIDTKVGALAVPVNIARTGWWVDGSRPGNKAGTILVGGHVDSATRGSGAFFRLRAARAGDVIQLTASDGKNRRYRVTTRRQILKENLPVGVFNKRGAHRLVLVTCGGPFLTGEGVYRDNIVVTAVPI